MALLVEALIILLNGIWSLLEVGTLGVNLHNFDSIAVTRDMVLANFSKLQGWRNIFDFKFSVKERLPSKISAVWRFHVAVQPIKDVFACTIENWFWINPGKKIWNWPSSSPFDSCNSRATNGTIFLGNLSSLLLLFFLFQISVTDVNFGFVFTLVVIIILVIWGFGLIIKQFHATSSFVSLFHFIEADAHNTRLRNSVREGSVDYFERVISSVRQIVSWI